MSNTLSQFVGNVKGKAQDTVDAVFPPDKRSAVFSKLQTFAVANPKLAAFFLANIALTGLPLLTFIVFALTVFVFSLVAALLVGVVVALLFTAFMVGIALLIVLPTVFITTFAASFIFLCGIGGYYILKWLNQGESPLKQGSTIGDALNSLTGGRLSFFTDSPRKKEVDHGKDHSKRPKKLNSESPTVNGTKEADNASDNHSDAGSKAKPVGPE